MERTNVKKIQTYLGFCIRAGKIAFGVDNAEKQKKGVFLLLADEGLGASSFKTIVKLKEKFACPTLILEGGLLAELVHRPAVKAAAVKDENLAAAILATSEGESQIKIHSGGNN